MWVAWSALLNKELFHYKMLLSSKKGIFWLKKILHKKILNFISSVRERETELREFFLLNAFSNILDNYSVTFITDNWNIAWKQSDMSLKPPKTYFCPVCLICITMLVILLMCYFWFVLRKYQCREQRGRRRSETWCFTRLGNLSLSDLQTLFSRI